MIAILLMTILSIRSILLIFEGVSEPVAYEGQGYEVYVLCTICIYPILGLSSAPLKPGTFLFAKKAGMQPSKHVGCSLTT